MNLKLIDTAIRSYAQSLNDRDLGRLALFRLIWGEQDRIARTHTSAWEAPQSEEAAELLRQGRPLFTDRPVPIDATTYITAARVVSKILVEAKVLAPQALSDLAGIDWIAITSLVDLARAGAEPPAYLEEVCATLFEGGLPEDSARLGGLVASLALRPLLQGPAEAAAKVLKKAAPEARPLLCPICGTAPSISRVAGTSAKGRTRTLWCSQCATEWLFDRVRCARCGTHNQGHLHFHHIDSDDSHRIATCDECGGYIRTIYVEESEILAPFSFEVEDVMTARLDAIANDPSFRGMMQE